MTHQTAAPPLLPPAELSTRRLIILGVLTRFFTDTGVQLFFPFLPVIAKGMGITPEVLGRLVSVRSAMGLFSPLFGILMDRYSYRMVMRLGLMLAAAGLVMVGSSNGWLMALIGMVLMGLGSFSFVPALQAYLSNRLPYARRARGLGIVEYAWAIAGILGLSVMGQIIAMTSWRVPFFMIGLALFIFSFVYRILPSAREHKGEQQSGIAAAAFPRSSWSQFFDLGSQRRSTWAALIGGGLIMFATWHTFLNYGTWLEREYGLDAAAIGIVAAVLGIADLIASVLASLLTDRLGKQPSVIGGTILGAVSFLLLPVLNQNLIGVVTGLVLARFFFEFSVVSNLALISEQAPAQRGKVLTFGAACALIGSTLAGLTGPPAYETVGPWGLGIVSALLMLTACLLYAALVREPQEAQG